MSYSPVLGNPKPQYEDSNGNPYVGMRLFFYQAGTSTKQNTQTTSAGSVNNTNPVVIDANGYPTGGVGIYGDTANSYKIVAAAPGSDDPPTSSLWTLDNVTAVVHSNLTASGGSALVGFIQEGTGAVATTQQVKDRQEFSAFDFMTTAEIADVRANTETIQVHTKLQAAIDALSTRGGGTLILPAGTCRISVALTVPRKVSIRGEGADVSILSCLNCNGINFTSASYDGGCNYYSDFAVCGASGASGNWAAFQSIIPSGGVAGTDSRDGLYFHRLKVYDFNQAWILASTWESHIHECRAFRVNQVVSLGNYAMVMRITSNNFTYEGGFASGTANKRGIELLGSVTEGIFIIGNQFSGFERSIYILAGVYVLIDNNDTYSTVVGIDLPGACSTGCDIKNNYIEVATNGKGIYGAGQGSEISNLYCVTNNVFIGAGGTTGTIGILIGEIANTYQWHWRIRDNHFLNLATGDIVAYNTRDVVIDGNRFDSTTPTYNITITGGSTSYYGIYIRNNHLAKAISADATDLSTGRVLIYHNQVSGAYALGNFISTRVQAINALYTYWGAVPINTGSNADIDYVLPDLSMHTITAYLETNTNTHIGAGLYAVTRQGTSSTVGTAIAIAGIAVTVTGAYKLNIANTTGSNGTMRVSITKTQQP